MGCEPPNSLRELQRGAKELSQAVPGDGAKAFVQSLLALVQARILEKLRLRALRSDRL